MGSIDYKAHIELNKEQEEEQYQEKQERFQKTITAKKPEIIPPPKNESARVPWYNELRRRAKETAKQAQAESSFYKFQVTSGHYPQAMLRALGLDLKDGELLSYLEQAFKSKEYKQHIVEIEGRNYYWVSHAAIVRALPILGIANKEQVARRLKALVDCGVLYAHSIDISVGDKISRPAEFRTAGRRTLYALDEKLMEVLREDVGPA